MEELEKYLEQYSGSVYLGSGLLPSQNSIDFPLVHAVHVQTGVEEDGSKRRLTEDLKNIPKMKVFEEEDENIPDYKDMLEDVFYIILDKDMLKE